LPSCSTETIAVVIVNRGGRIAWQESGEFDRIHFSALTAALEG